MKYSLISLEMFLVIPLAAASCKKSSTLLGDITLLKLLSK